MKIYSFVKPKSNHITIKAFRNRFTMEEKVAIEDAAKENTTVKVFLEDLHSSTFVNLNDEQLIQGLEALESLGLIDEGRAEVITQSPIQPNERV